MVGAQEATVGFEVPRTNPAAFPPGPLSFISLCSLHSTCWPATSQLPSAFKVALDGHRWGAGLPGLPANSSLNSRLGMQDGPARSRSPLSAPWVLPGFRRRPGPGSGAQLGELSPPPFSHRHCSDGCPLEGERGGAGQEGFRVQSSPLRGTLGSHSLAGCTEEQLPGWYGADGGRPFPSLLRNLNCAGIGRAQSQRQVARRSWETRGRKSGTKTRAVGNKGEKRGEENLSGVPVTTPFPR